MRTLVAGIALVIVAAAAAGYWQYSTVRPVKLVASEYDDVCGTLSKVAPQDGAMAALHARPSAWSRQIAHLAAGSQVIVCEVSGEWSGVIVKDEACQIDHDAGHTVDYSGPCVSGWIRSRLLGLLAG